MTIIKSEFALALNQVANERGISVDDVISSIEVAIIAAYKKQYPNEDVTNLVAKINKNTGETKIFKNNQDITPPGFGRIAAQTAKQVILQKIREIEKKTIINIFKKQISTITKARIIRFDGNNYYLDIGKTEVVLPKEEQIKNEKYQINLSLIVYLKEIIEDKFGNSRIIVSRTNPNLIKELFKREVPEITNNAVEIKNVVRIPGERAKIAVYTNQKGVDPIGACVGQKGIRVQTVTDELGGQEKIDIIQWNSDDKLFLMAALSPAKINNIEINKKERKAKVFVNETEAPLAIGKNGININLASRLTNYEIDIIQEQKMNSSEKKQSENQTLPQDTQI